MFQIWKMLFPKLLFGLDDLNPGGGAPSSQPPSDDGNAPPPAGDPPPPAPTDFVELEGVKVPQSTFEKIARERYKDAFEARENRDKWQAENTREAQRLKQLERDADAYRALKANPPNQPSPRNEYEAMKEDYIREKSEFYPDADPQKLKAFLGKEFDWNAKLAGFKAQETIQPIHERSAAEFEQKFLEAHPKVQSGSPQYQEIAELLGQGVNPEKAYQIVFHEDILKEKTDLALKARDDERLKKLKASPPNSQDGDKPMTGSRSDRIWRAMEKHGVGRE